MDILKISFIAVIIACVIVLMYFLYKINFSLIKKIKALEEDYEYVFLYNSKIITALLFFSMLPLFNIVVTLSLSVLYVYYKINLIADDIFNGKNK